jgi:hypothetical protein
VGGFLRLGWRLGLGGFVFRSSVVFWSRSRGWSVSWPWSRSWSRGWVVSGCRHSRSWGGRLSWSWCGSGS